VTSRDDLGAGRKAAGVLVTRPGAAAAAAAAVVLILRLPVTKNTGVAGLAKRGDKATARAVHLLHLIHHILPSVLTAMARRVVRSKKQTVDPPIHRNQIVLLAVRCLPVPFHPTVNRKELKLKQGLRDANRHARPPGVVILAAVQVVLDQTLRRLRSA
jgi:hypothetical protein